MIGRELWLYYRDCRRVKACEIVAADPDASDGVALAGECGYTAEYLASPRAFALDPVALPLESRIFQASNPHSGIHQVFEDSLPDDWGGGERYRLPARHPVVPLVPLESRALA